MVDTQHLKCCEQLLVWVRVPPLVRLKNGGLAQLARASALHAEGHRFDSDILHIVTIRKNGGTDAKYEMETWGNPDTNRTAVTTLYAGVAEK